MLRLTDAAAAHFRRLLDREAVAGLGVRLGAVQPGTARADVRLEFAEPGDLDGDEWSMACDGFTLWVAADSLVWLDGAEIDYSVQGANGQLQIRAPKIKGQAPAAEAALAERVQWVIEHDINPQLAQHRGHVRVEDVSAEGVVTLRFGGGCQGCGLVDVTLKQGIERTLLDAVPGVTAVRDTTDHASGSAPYAPRDGSC